LGARQSDRRVVRSSSFDDGRESERSVLRLRPDVLILMLTAQLAPNCRSARCGSFVARASSERAGAMAAWDT